MADSNYFRRILYWKRLDVELNMLSTIVPLKGGLTSTIPPYIKGESL